MITAISQFNGFEKCFEGLEHYQADIGEKSRRVSFSSWNNQKNVVHWYDKKLTNDTFFEVEKKYHLNFRLEFIA